MGSFNFLRVGNIDIDYGKNDACINYSYLFNESEFIYVTNIYYDESGEKYYDNVSMYKCSLSKIKTRLDILGYTLNNVQYLYEELLENTYCSDLTLLSFTEFSELLKNIDWITFYKSNKTKDTYLYLNLFAKFIILPEAKKYPSFYQGYINKQSSFEIYVGEFFNNLNPLIILRLLCENPNYDKLDIIFEFSEIIDDGWADISYFTAPLSEDNKVLIVTEGKSDIYILKKCIEAMYPDSSYLFSYADMYQYGYNASSASQLTNICVSLLDFNVKKKMIVLLDNDYAGNQQYLRLKNILKQRKIGEEFNNFLFLKLPDFPEFNSFPVRNNETVNLRNINGTAVSIECFLDFNSCNYQPEIVLKDEKTHQGNLNFKEKYYETFRKANLLDDSYDTTKLKYLIDFILREWIEFTSL